MKIILKNVNSGVEGDGKVAEVSFRIRRLLAALAERRPEERGARLARGYQAGDAGFVPRVSAASMAWRRQRSLHAHAVALTTTNVCDCKIRSSQVSRIAPRRTDRRRHLERKRQ